MSRFLPNEANRRLLPGFVCICISAFGTALGFAASYLELHALFLVAYGIVALGVAGGLLCVLYGWWAVLTGRGRIGE